jgi:hypothetical protein
MREDSVLRIRPFPTFLCLLLAMRIASATSVVAPTFRELVAEAQLVFVGDVTSTQTLWTGTGQERAIVTEVTFTVQSTLKGVASSRQVLRFLGGTLEGYTLTIPGVPQFNVGDRAVLFVSSDTHAISPLVGVMHGRFPIKVASDGYEYVTLHDGRAFSSVEQVGPAPVITSRTPLRTMRRVDFEREIRLELQQSPRAR